MVGPVTNSILLRRIQPNPLAALFTVNLMRLDFADERISLEDCFPLELGPYLTLGFVWRSYGGGSDGRCFFVVVIFVVILFLTGRWWWAALAPEKREMRGENAE